MNPRRRRRPAPTRTRSSSRRTSSSAARDAGRARRQARAARQPGPDVPGGGTVAYVNPDEHRYLDDPVHREEGGTPGDRRVDPRRAGVPAQGGRRRRRRSASARRRFIHRAIASWRETRASRSSATSTAGGSRSCRSSSAHRAAVPAPQLRRRAAQRPVRHPVARRLLLRRPVRPSPARHRPRRRTSSSARSPRGCEGIKPGWVRVNFNYFLGDAVRGLPPRRRCTSVANDGWRCCRTTGSIPTPAMWRHRAAQRDRRVSLVDVSYRAAARWSTARATRPSPSGRWPATSRRRTASSPSLADELGDDDAPRTRSLPRDFEQLRWFPLPGEAHAALPAELVRAGAAQRRALLALAEREAGRERRAVVPRARRSARPSPGRA